MAAIEVNAIVLESLKRAYAERYGRSPGLLVAALNKSFSEELNYIRSKQGASQRDLISDKTLRNFFSASPPVSLQERSLNFLCKLLLGYNSYQEAKEKLEQGDRPNETNVAIVLTAPNQNDWLPAYQKHIKEICGKIRTLDMNQPVPLEGVYADVLVREGLRKQRQRTIAELYAELDANPEKRNLGDYSLSNVDPEKRVSGLEAVEQYSRLVILGSPGAGKTTFCKYLALHYLFDKKGEDLIPIYIPLKDFAESEGQPSLTMRVTTEFRSSVGDSKAITEAWLSQGKCLLLLDGLDEVVRSDEDRVFRSIRDFIRQYSNNHFIITCRTAAQDHTNFDNFTVVELADFSNSQIEQFITKWFSNREAMKQLTSTKAQNYIQRFLAKLNESKAVKELATNPLMLTMLCYLFEDSYNFPKNRYSLYGDTVDALLRRWDASRRIERDEEHGEKLTRIRKINLLSKIAYDGFNQKQKKRFWKKWELEEEIRKFIENITGFKEPEVDSQNILKELELNHGLIAEQFRGIYNFSHLTFQEFFTARYILDNSDSLSHIKKAIDEHLTDPGWREVFLVIAGRLSDLDQFLRWMFDKLVQLTDTDGLQKMLNWLFQTTDACEVPSSAWRAFFFAVDLDTALYIDRSTKISRDRANRFATTLREYNQETGKLVMRSRRASLILGLVAIHALADTSNKEPNEFVVQNIGVKGDIDEKLGKAIELTHELDLEKELIRLKQNFPAAEITDPQWKDWAEDLRQVMMKYLQVGYEEHLTDAETKSLDDYLYVGNLIMDCIQSDTYVSKDLREKIIDNLLLPKEKIDQDLLPQSNPDAPIASSAV